MTIADRRPPAIAPAFVASLVVHGALGFALFGLVSSGRPGPAEAIAPLAVRLVGPPAPATAPPSPQTTDAVVTADTAAQALPSPSTEANAPPTPAMTAAAPVAAAEAPPADAAAAPPPGTVAVRENYAAMAGISTDIVARAHSDYLIEVEKTVRVLRLPEVPYPPEALAAGRQDTVVAWIAVDREGAIEDVVIDSGEPEFAAAVLAALPTAKFLPAEERGEIIPFYIVLQFDFRTTGGAVAPSANASEPPR